MTSGRWLVSGGTLLLSVALWSNVPGCGGAASRRQQLESGNPLDRARGAVDAAEARDVKAAPWLVGLLEDSDEGVRLVAIRALRQLFGEDYGYRYYASTGERAPAVARWQEALRSGTLKVPATARATEIVPSPATAPASAGGAAQEIVHGAEAGPR